MPYHTSIGLPCSSHRRDLYTSGCLAVLTPHRLFRYQLPISPDVICWLCLGDRDEIAVGADVAEANVVLPLPLLRSRASSKEDNQSLHAFRTPITRRHGTGFDAPRFLRALRSHEFIGH